MPGSDIGSEVDITPFLTRNLSTSTSSDSHCSVVVEWRYLFLSSLIGNLVTKSSLVATTDSSSASDRSWEEKESKKSTTAAHLYR